MPQTRRILTSNNWFWSTLRYAHRGLPWVEIGQTQEIEWPYRHSRSLVVRLPLTKTALVVGRWGPPRGEEEALLQAIRGEFRHLRDLNVRP